MTVLECPAATERPAVHVDTASADLLDGLLIKLQQAGIGLAPELNPPLETVILAAGDTVDEAIESYTRASRPRPPRPWGSRLLIVADSYPRSGTLRAVRAGARVMIRSTQTDADSLAAAVRAASNGDCRLPHVAMLRILGAAEEQGNPLDDPASRATLTPRQTTVLTLIAEGFGNAAIAEALSVSEHTVKNIIYDLMARLQVHSRAHAVAYGVRAGLI